jgi:hypothetical protein
LLALKSWLVTYNIADAAILIILSAVCVIGFVLSLRLFPSLFGEEGQLVISYLEKLTGRIRPGRGPKT